MNSPRPGLEDITDFRITVRVVAGFFIDRGSKFYGKYSRPSYLGNAIASGPYRFSPVPDLQYSCLQALCL